MNQSRLYVVGIAAFVLGGIVGGYFRPQLGHSDASLRLGVQQFNRRVQQLIAGPRVPAASIGWVNPPELDRPVFWILYALMPPLAVAAILGLWARTVFWFLAQFRIRLKELLFLNPIDFKPKQCKAVAKS